MTTILRKKNKYNAQRTIVDGESFPSKLEANTWCALKMMEKQGKIRELMRYPSIRLGAAKIGYKPDFKWIDKVTDKYVWGEAKGLETDRFRMIRRLWKEYGPGELVIFKAGRNGWVRATETIKPKGEKCDDKE